MQINDSEKIKIFAIIYNDAISKSDVVVCLEGDAYCRIYETIKIFKEGLAEKILISGGFDNPPFAIPAEKMAKKFIEERIPEDKIIIENKSKNTYEQGMETMKLAKDNGWRKIILVASNFHQPRAYLTFLKAMEDSGLDILIYNRPARDLPWLSSTALGENRCELFEDELEKIAKYQKISHIISFSKVLDYQKWKEEQ